MDRPFVFCHMETSLDGKIMGKYLWLPESDADVDSFYAIAFGPDAKYQFQALILGRTTIDDNLTLYKKPDLPQQAQPVPAGDFLAPGAAAGLYYIAVDGHGRLAWPDNVVEEGGKKMHVVDIITEQVPDSYRQFLRQKGISYLVCGSTQVDLAQACDKISHLLHVDSMMLGGGAVLNWSFIQAGLVDEVSQVIAPAADGNPDTQPLFLARPGLTTDQPVVFKPQEVKIMPDDAVWIRYTVGKTSTFDFDNDPEFKAVQDMIKAHQ